MNTYVIEIFKYPKPCDKPIIVGSFEQVASSHDMAEAIGNTVLDNMDIHGFVNVWRKTND